MTEFKIGDKVEFGVRQYWTGKGHPGIPAYSGVVEYATLPFAKVPTLWVRCSEYSNNQIVFTQRKNGNFVMKGHADDNFHGYSRVALRKHFKQLETAE